MAIRLPAWAGRGSAEPVASTPALVPSSATPQPSPAVIDRGRRSLAAIQSSSSPKRRLAQLERWLADYPNHPDTPRARRMRGQAGLRVPVLRFAHARREDGSVRIWVVARFAGPGRALSVGNDHTVALWDLSAPETPLWRLRPEG